MSKTLTLNKSKSSKKSNLVVEKQPENDQIELIQEIGKKNAEQQKVVVKPVSVEIKAEDIAVTPESLTQPPKDIKMSDIDLSKLSLDELDKLLNNAAEAKSKKRKEEVAGAIVTIQGLVDKYNILPHEIFGNLAKYGDKPTKLSKDKKDPKSAKYIFTDEKGEFHHWFAGKGPRPQFIKDILGEDKKEADCTKELAKYLNPNWK